MDEGAKPFPLRAEACRKRLLQVSPLWMDEGASYFLCKHSERLAAFNQSLKAPIRPIIAKDLSLRAIQASQS